MGPSKRGTLLAKQATVPIQGLQEDAWPRNLHLLEEIHSNLLQPTLITMNSLLSACEKASEWQLALQLLTLDMGVVVQWGENIRAQYLWSDRLNSHRSEVPADQPQTFQMAQPRTSTLMRPDVISFNSSISACEKASAWRKALRLLDDLDDRRRLSMTWQQGHFGPHWMEKNGEKQIFIGEHPPTAGLVT